jgi:glycosyltransferase involved in cell wall biosynthesis
MKLDNTDPVPLVHGISLNRIGGVERLFEGYLHGSDHARIAHHVLLLHGPCHPDVRAIVEENTAGMGDLKRCGPLRLPRWPGSIRRWRFGRLVRADHARGLVLWNALGNRTVRSAAGRLQDIPTLYYDNGGAWGSYDASSVRSFLRNTRRVVCACRASQRMLELKWGMREGAATIISNALRPDVADRPAQPRKLPEKGPVRLGVAGRLIPVKGVPVAIHALRICRERGLDCRLDIAGVGSGRERFEALAGELGVTPYTRFLGMVEQMDDFYHQIDLFLCPSLRDPQPLVCIEALGSGCPVIGTAVDGIPEIVMDGRTGFCIPPTLEQADYRRLGGDPDGLLAHVYDPGADALAPPRPADPQRFAEKVLYLCEHPREYERLSGAAIEHVRSEFSFGDYVAALDEQLLDLCEPR